jgi:predicted PhzF superfamily epimerase YddE/YHI9
MPIRCWQVDAFTNRPFGGNPAAVCWLEHPADDRWMQSVAAEMNLSETAFVRPLEHDYELRWYTPTVEVDLCGHATLATAHALWHSKLVPPDEPLRFQTRSGRLTCRRDGRFIELDFPASIPVEAPPPPGLLEAMGVRPLFAARTQFDFLIALESEEAVRNVRPDYVRLGEIPVRGVIVTAPSADPQFDFASRFFAPAVGVNEDPVCGSAHCALAPYWAGRLGRRDLLAHQVSAREGVLRLKWRDDRVLLGGEAVTVWQGELL